VGTHVNMMRNHQIKKAIIPAAGMGTRFLPATKASPKEMLPLLDKPVIQYVVEEAVASGITEIIIVTGRGKRAIEDHFDVSFELEEMLKRAGKNDKAKEMRKISELADFCYIRQKEALGLGHAILCAKNLIGDEPFAVLLGDDVMDSRYPALRQMAEIYRRTLSPIIGVQQIPRSESSHYGMVQTKRLEETLYEISDLVEKPLPADAPSDLAVIGRYILVPEIFDILESLSPGKNNEIQLTDGLRKLAHQEAMYGVLLEGTRFDTGDKLGFLKATVEFGLKNQEWGTAFRQYLKELLY